MTFDLELIERALNQAVCDAEDALAERRRNYAGYPGVGKFALYEDAVRDAKAARAELTAVKARIEAAPLTTFRRAMLGTPHAWVEETFACPEWIGKRVRLVVEE